MKIDPYLEKIIQDEQLVEILNTIFDGIYITNLGREIVFWNKGAEEITGYKAKEVMHKRCSANILNHIDENGKLLCQAECPLTNCIKKDIIVKEKVYPKHKNDHRFPVFTHVAPLKNENGKIVGAIEVFRDITKEEDYKILQEKFNTFVKRFISKNTYDEIVSQVTEGKSEMNELKDLTILYLDIVDFTTISEPLSPNEVADLLNNLFGICDVITREYYGDIDKFIGDSIMATFIDPNDAVGAALKIVEALKHFNNDYTMRNKSEIKLHIGINSGTVVQVEVGTQDRKDFTVIGDVVNTAARIQSIAEPDTVFISEATLARLENKDQFEFAGDKVLKGKKEKVKVYKYKA
ncbi:MAG: hypothetical protein C0599_16710 [Salinivirgaceae bacterium]|nr:MAG: hypothetical protein C0599_16710 [Salinivirgaceae bacterium]